MTLMKGVRIQRGVRQHQLADLIGVTRPVISNIENGYWNPTTEQRDKIARFLGLDPVKLLTHVADDALVGPGDEARNGE